MGTIAIILGLIPGPVLHRLKLFRSFIPRDYHHEKYFNLAL